MTCAGSPMLVRRRAAAALLGCALTASLAARPAAAQTVPGFALDHFEPSGGGSDWFTLESLDFRGSLRPAVSLSGDWAWKPLVIYDVSGSAKTAVVRHRVL